ncbi:MAG: peptidylprolyl isomerase, partial [Bacteroidales bacterium]|nr:peptidylprolyl isomerase [Bacteroidales bacterium]
EGFYNGLIFHRVIKDFMIQGGDPNSKNAKPNQMYGDGGPGYTIPAEINANKFWHKKGALSAARMGDQVNPKKESSGSQFYIVQGKKVTDAEFANYQAYGYSFNEEQKKSYKEIGGTPHLDREYTVFGEVVKGLHVIDAIASVPTNPKLGDRPLTDVKMEIEHLGKMTNEEIQKL